MKAGNNGGQLDIFTDPRANKCGVIADDLAEILSGTGWTIKVMQFADGLWRAAPGFHGKDWGFSWPLSVDDQGYLMRSYAVAHAVREIRFYLSKHPDTAQHRKAIAEIDQLTAPGTSL